MPKCKDCIHFFVCANVYGDVQADTEIVNIDGQKCYYFRAKSNEHIYCAVDKNNNIQWVLGSSKKTRYFRTTKYLSNAVKYHNRTYPNDKWTIKKYQLLEVPEDVNE